MNSLIENWQYISLSPSKNRKIELKMEVDNDSSGEMEVDREVAKLKTTNFDQCAHVLHFGTSTSVTKF